MSALPDVNVLVALAWPQHIHHAAARTWFSESAPAGWATCAVTQAGFIRVSSNPAAIPDARTPAEAAHLLGLYIARPDHEFLVDDVPLTDGMRAVHGHRQVPDAHLVQLAAHHGCHVVTFDRGVTESCAAWGGRAHLLRW